jgi:hypothetical protein
MAQAEPFGGYRMMNPRRFSTVAVALCGTGVLAGWAVASFSGAGSAGIERAGAVPIEDRRAPSPTVDAERADATHAVATSAPLVANVDVARAVELVTQPATETTAVSDEPESIVKAALPDSSQMMPPEAPSVQVATANTADPVPNDINDDVKETVSSVEILGECLVVEICIDQYLWALYQRAPKEDTAKVPEQRKVTVRRKGKTVTVTKTFTRLVPQDFTWKDPKAAERAGMPMFDYVIGGMDRGFKLKLFHALHAAEQAGLSPGITSAFRDDYRQSIASGLKAAADRSYHGGSFRGGYGHGLAADIVSVKGATKAERWASTERLWKWIDTRGKEFGVGRPYLDRDPPHVAPIDGREYASRRGPKTQTAESVVKKRKQVAARVDRRVIRTTSALRPKTSVKTSVKANIKTNTKANKQVAQARK